MNGTPVEKFYKQSKNMKYRNCIRDIYNDFIHDKEFNNNILMSHLYDTSDINNIKNAFDQLKTTRSEFFHAWTCLLCALKYKPVYLSELPHKKWINVGTF
jgi:hypothetical protein